MSYVWFDEIGYVCNNCPSGYFLVEIDAPTLTRGCSIYNLPGVSKYQVVVGVNDINGNKLLTQKVCKSP